METFLVDTFYVPESYVPTLVKKIKHPVHDIWIYNYTQYCNGKRLWDDITKTCRSLILDKENHIVARGFPKFFNYSEPEAELFDEEYEIYEKLDGSIILLFFYNNEWIFSSKGSFENNQVQKAKELMPESMKETLDKELTYVYEIIYPTNRIIVNYGSREELVYLSSFTKGGIEKNVNKSLIVSKSGTFQELQKEDSDLEGYVIRYKSGKRVKVKFLRYLRNHILHSNLTPEKIKKLFASSTLEQLLIDYEEEIHDFIKQEWSKLENQYSIKYNQLKEEFDLFFTKDRKQFYSNINKSPNKTILSYIYSDKMDSARKAIVEIM